MQEPSSSQSKSPVLNTSKPLNPDEAHKMLKEEHITRLTDEAIRKLAAYTRNELEATIDDCQLLETMNKVTKEKYERMSQMSHRLVEEISRIQATYEDFSTFEKQVDDITEQTVHIEKIARALDEYSRHLETKLNKAISMAQTQRPTSS
ncbi:biogenesis of lysosome-related organelles complex-1 subunit 2-domain-containing protein [Dichotomocladium elegans]|nr:biogenesis of lysosome-related organelles complex-1 subunit 2-domain-containing protein [Dichotomocladium elegans]